MDNYQNINNFNSISTHQHQLYNNSEIEKTANDCSNETHNNHNSPFFYQNNQLSKNKMSTVLNEKNGNDNCLEYQIAQALKKLSNHYYNNPNYKKNIENSMIFNYYCSPFFIEQNNCFLFDSNNGNGLNFAFNGK